ncbi:uncharacterized protein LOC125076261 [Vanessa atalanta]|uniref:uncharacterized protein LOC125076261 n=1 Tax=Vanessa atalanta TaxID=42275 RepID=UPI001FCDE5A4|nr:uncharacterized protein LOC125076261 [Vanessa atalanta]XP_047544313.1 uncharacterized protein LOC125076261 [Vanessa atalanta]
MARIILEVKQELPDDDYVTMTSNSSATSSDTDDTKDNIRLPIMERLDRVFKQLDEIVKPNTPEPREYLEMVDDPDCDIAQTRAEAWARQNQEYQNKCPDYEWFHKYREPRRQAASPPPQPRKGCDIKTSADREAAVNKIYALVKDIDNVIYRKPNIKINRPPMYFSSRHGGSNTASTSTSTRPRRDKRHLNISPASVIIHCSKCKSLNRHITYLRNRHQASRRNRIFF